jgi:hypothetical protein
MSKWNYLTLLQSAIQQAHQCTAVHSQTVPVHEMHAGQTIWKGEVEIFDLDGHAESKKCYAWLHEVKERNIRFMTALQNRVISSPEMAVKSAIFFGHQPAPHPRPNSSP